MVINICIGQIKEAGCRMIVRIGSVAVATIGIAIGLWIARRLTSVRQHVTTLYPQGLKRGLPATMKANERS